MSKSDLSKSEWYESCVKPHEPMVKNWLISRYGDCCEVDDVMQEALLKLMEAHQVKAIESPKTYFFAIARNIAVSSVRKSKVRSIVTKMDESILDVIDEDVSVEESAARNHEIEILTRAIQELPDRCRQIFTLNKVYGMSYQSIADKLGISLNTVSNQIAIGLYKCMDYMQRYGKN